MREIENYIWINVINKRNIRLYCKYKEKRKPKGVVYTCIVGEYDRLQHQKYFDINWDYICFTDNEKIKSDGVWEIKKLEYIEKDNTRTNRKHKILSHLILSEYERSLYIDGNIIIKSAKFFNILEKNKDSIFMAGIHPERICLYEEAEVCKNLKLEKNEIIDKQIELIKQNKFPCNYGLYDASMLYRNHKNEKIIQLNEEWWWFIENLAKRDQLSLTYICWKNNIPFKTFSKKSFRLKNKYVKIIPHLIIRK